MQQEKNTEQPAKTNKLRAKTKKQQAKTKKQGVKSITSFLPFSDCLPVESILMYTKEDTVISNYDIDVDNISPCNQKENDTRRILLKT